MNQIVYVITDLFNKVIIGVYNAYEDAMKAVAAINGYGNPCVQVTPVLVDAPADDMREACNTPEEVEQALEREFDIAEVLAEGDDEEEEEEDASLALTPKGELLLRLLEAGLSLEVAEQIANETYDEDVPAEQEETPVDPEPEDVPAEPEEEEVEISPEVIEKFIAGLIANGVIRIVSQGE